MSVADFTIFPDLALRTLGGAVIWANDEAFAEREALIRPGKAGYQPATFGHKGQVYDGWETRRRRVAGHDEAIVRLGVPGVVRGVVVDTAWFKGNYPPEISVEGLSVDGYPDPQELATSGEWQSIVERSAVSGDSENPFAVRSDQRWTHVKLTIYPDGGVARFRVHGEARPDVRFLDAGPLDLAALENGGRVTDCSNMFYSSPQNILFPGRAASMGDGWETARRRDDGNDWVQVQLAGEGSLSFLEVDTSYFLGNAPGAGSLSGRTSSGEWIELLPRTVFRPDTRHRFLIERDVSVTDVRLDIFPDGGLARLRVFGTLTAAARTAISSQ